MAKWPNHLYKTMVILDVTWHKMVRFPYIKYVDGGDGPETYTYYNVYGIVFDEFLRKDTAFSVFPGSYADDNTNAIDERCF